MSNKEESNIVDIQLDTMDTSNQEGGSVRNSFEQFQEIAKNIGRIMADMNPVERLKTIMESLQSVFRLDSVFGQEDVNNFRISIQNNLLEILHSITIPGISEERKQQLKELYSAWGKFGWTINPCSDYNTLFNSPCPENIKEADKLALKQCRNMNELFDYTRKKKRNKKSDFEEAVSNFNNRNYKSCALLLFSLIDARLIRLQGYSKPNKRRATGNQALKVIEQNSKHNFDEDILMIVLFYANISACIETVFSYGNDFKIQPEVINRNYLCHGMMTKRVSRKNCIQLFLLYYNVLELCEIFYGEC